MSAQVLQFKIVLLDILPPIWRRIQIDKHSTFWDLHIAIQNALGWKCFHPHQFELINVKSHQKEHMGTPHEELFKVQAILAGWEYYVKDYLVNNRQFLYEYDFKDSWLHLVEYESTQDKRPNQRYPVCLDGQRACPPENVGGLLGYHHFLNAIEDPTHEDHASLLEWVGGHFNPEAFDPKRVKFDNPAERWQWAFGETETIKTHRN